MFLLHQLCLWILSKMSIWKYFTSKDFFIHFYKAKKCVRRPQPLYYPGYFCSILLILPVCFSSSHVFGPAKENIGRVVQQEILPHLVLVQNINMKKWALWGVNVCPLSIPAPNTAARTSRPPCAPPPRLYTLSLALPVSL